MPAYTPDSIARGIIAEGRRSRSGEGQLDHPVMSVKGIIIALATGMVETNLTMYASHADPDSLNFPHDAVGSDANSVGVFQQRAPWWGTVADRMDVARSAAMFYSSLTRQRVGGQDYNTNAQTPGHWAQMVQQSAFPDRYDEAWSGSKRFPESAQSIYARLSGVAGPPVNTTTPYIPGRPDFVELDFMTGGGRSSRSRRPINFLLHTEEGNSTAEQLARYCDGSNNVSYHYTIRDRKVCDVVDTDFYSWSVLDANVFTVNACFAGSRASMSRQEWLAREADIEIAAYLAVQDARKYGFSTNVIAPPYRRGEGVSDHKYVTECLGIGTHTDVGPNFPWDVFSAHVIRYSTGELEDMAQVPQEQWDRVYRELTQQLPSRSIYRTPGEGPVDTLAGMALNTDAMAHQELIERLAITYGDPDAVKRIFLVANGEGADPKDQWAIDHAREVIARIPAEFQDNWKDA